jgi:predicted DNA-binding transcriptional regulator AlpA
VFEEALAGFTEGSEKDVKDLKVAEFKPRAGLVSVLLYTETIGHEPREGDLIYPGISLVHSSTGSHATQVATFIRRLVCRNGMTIRVCENEHKLRIRRLAQDGFDERDVLKQVRSMARKASTDFKVKLEAFGLLRDNKVADPEAALRRIARRLHLKKKLSDQLLQAFYEDELGVDETAFGLVNALARVVTHSPDLGDVQRIDLMESVGTYTQSSIRQCRLCSSILVDCPEVAPSTKTASTTDSAEAPWSEEAEVSDDKGASPEVEANPASAADAAYARLAELPSKKAITRAELAEIFGKSPKTIRRWIAKGDLPRPARTGRTSFWSAGEILDHIRKRQETATVRD